MRLGWLVLFALAVQALVFIIDFGDAGIVKRLLFPASYALLFAFVLLNRRRIGFLVIGVGMALNFLSIIANGGLMPVSPANMIEAGLEEELRGVERGQAIPHSWNVLLEESDTHLQGLTDRYVWEALGPVNVFSLGDVVIVAGLVVVLLEFLLPAVLRGSPDGTSAA